MALVAGKTRTAVVNAAFLQEVKDSNLQLWATLHELRALADSEHDVREASRLLVDKLSELRDCIGLEFSLEETYGFMEGAPHSFSSGLASASDAKIQHRELYLQLHELCEQAEEAQYRGTIGRDLRVLFSSFESFDACLRAHEELDPS